MRELIVSKLYNYVVDIDDLAQRCLDRDGEFFLEDYILQQCDSFITEDIFLLFSDHGVYAEVCQMLRKELDSGQ